MKKNMKGISLIVLIVTIIVMIIIAGAIIISLQNTNIIDRAENAVTEYNLVAEKEQIQLAVNDALIKGLGTVTEDYLKDALDAQLNEDGYSLLNNGDGTFSVTISSTKNTYKIENGSIQLVDSLINEEEYNKILTYFLGEDGEGNLGYEIVDGEVVPGFFNINTMKFIDNEIITDAETNLLIECMNVDESGNPYILARYNDVLYNIEIQMNIQDNENQQYIAKKVDVKYVKPEGTLLGSYVTYEGRNWIVLYDDNKNGLQLISAENVGEVTLGHDNSQYTGKADYVTDMDKVVAAYNDAIDKLNNACKELTGITENIRCVGGPATDTTTTYFTSSGIEGYTGTWFEDYEGKLKVGDENYTNDYNQIVNLGISTITNQAEFWMASRATYSPRNYSDADEVAPFYIRKVGAGELLYIDLCNMSYTTVFRAYGYAKTSGVRPVITLDSTIRENLANQTAHSGTSDDPYIIE